MSARVVTAGEILDGDQGFGPGFIKVCACFPYPAKIWDNGQARAAPISIQTHTSRPACPGPGMRDPG
jgi:hypothetical protein